MRYVAIGAGVGLIAVAVAVGGFALGYRHAKADSRDWQALANKAGAYFSECVNDLAECREGQQ